MLLVRVLRMEMCHELTIGTEKMSICCVGYSMGDLFSLHFHFICISVQLIAGNLKFAID